MRLTDIQQVSTQKSLRPIDALRVGTLHKDVPSGLEERAPHQISCQSRDDAGIPKLRSPELPLEEDVSRGADAVHEMMYERIGGGEKIRD